MNKSKFNTYWGIVLLVLLFWSIWEVIPPTPKDLLQEFDRLAANRDQTFQTILNQTRAYIKAGTNNEFLAIEIAAGTNDLRRYFPLPGLGDTRNPNQAVLNRLQRDASGRIKLGLDLQGGTSFLVRLDTSKLSTNTDNETIGALSQAIEVLRRRIDPYGVVEPVFQPVGNDRILIQLPGLSESDKAAAREAITKKAYLEFRLVHENSANILKSGDPIPPGYHLMKIYRNKQAAETYVVKNTAENGLSGDIVQDAQAVRAPTGEIKIEFKMTDDGAKRFGDVTRENVGRQLAVVLDNELVTAPTINTPIETGSGEITGSYTAEEAQRLANILQNPLRAPLIVESSTDVGATLGKDSIASGIKASVYGVIFVSLFMLLYYQLAGLAANIALITNVIILLGVMCYNHTSFTLPGIAGGVLTVGMAVDANVLIYERIREELAKGKGLRSAISAGYDRAFGTIFDSHVTTLISSIILIFRGTGEIKGFGVTLTIGVAASLFTALVVTRLIFNFLLDMNWIKTLRMAHIIRSSTVNFMSVSKALSIITTLFVIGSLVLGISRGSKMFGIDFNGGDSTTYTFAQKYEENEIRAVLPASEQGAIIQYQKGDSTETLRVTSSSGSADKVQAALEKGLPKAHFKLEVRQQVGASLGLEIRQSAVVASLLALFGILVYVAFRYEFSFAVAAVLAVLHDVFFAIGAYCVATVVSGRQFNATVVAAILTIIGFSINDKIVIFDRIRENLKLGARGSFKEIINQALNQTLSRTIITSGTVLIATASLYFFGGGVINDFAFTFLVGVIIGTYSSIFVACTIILWWHKGERPHIGSGATPAAINPGNPAKPAIAEPGKA